MAKIKKGDTVAMRKGKDRGKSGKVLRVDPASGRMVVEGLNLVKKHVRPRRQGEKGQLVAVPRAVAPGNVALFCTHCNRAVRVGFRVEREKKTRACKRCGNAL